jgi:hypothetical protein
MSILWIFELGCYNNEHNTEYLLVQSVPKSSFYASVSVVFSKYHPKIDISQSSFVYEGLVCITNKPLRT